MKKILLTALFFFLLISCKKEEKENPADAIYFGGEIITMEGDTPQYVEAIAIKGDSIFFMGTMKEAEVFKGSNTKMIDLEGKTLLPGFIDPHSHFINSLSMSSQANCSAPPVGKSDSPEKIVASLVAFQKERNIPEKELIMGYGYDDTQMIDGNLLNRDHLDAAFPNNPVMVVHVSLHGAVLNSKALEKFNINEKTETPPGGIIVRKPGTNEPYGLIMETAYLKVFANLPKPTPEQVKEQIKAGQMMYAEAGITTAHEGASHMSDLKIFQTAAENKEFFIDLISYPFITDFEEVMEAYKPTDFGKYNNGFKLGGIKITIDGSPQGRTAYFTTPYLTGGPGGEKDWKGQPTFTQEMVNEMLKKVYDNNLQSTFHANGDAAIDMCIKAHEYASNGKPSEDRRTTIIHSQFVRKDQLDKYVEYKMIPSLYTEHTFFFADAHIKNRGLEQASFISPMKTAISKGLRPTNHTDFNVAPIDQLLVVWSAVNRISRNGQVIGADERITPYQALQAITTNAAYQYFEENKKGSLKVGKLADLVILDKNPLKVVPETIKEIKVVETIKNGKSIYKAKK
ncbi:MAG: amidohydrolase [Flavobacteriales bacterium]|nr:amidohydrolase [Flavobacteriales bacterium]